MAVSGVIGRGNLQKLSVHLEPPEEIYAGLPTLVRVELRNGRRWLPAFLIQVELAGTQATFHAVGRRKSATLLVPLTCPLRGEHLLAPLRLRSIFPINFFVRTNPLGAAGPVTVFPSPLPCPGASGLEGRSGGAARESKARGLEGEISRIGDYSGTEPLRLIHWKLSARQGDLKVKELSAVTREPLLVDLALLPGGGLEARLGCAVHLINRAGREGRPVGLRLGGQTIPPEEGRAHRLRLLRELACHGAH